MPSVNKTETIQLNQWQSNEYPKMDDFNSDNLKIDNKFKVHDTQLSDMDYQTGTGTGTAITLTMQTLRNGYAKTFIASANNGGATTTINGKKLYKPSTTISPTLIAGKAYTVWYNLSGDCFFIKASAEGNALASQVLKDITFSNENDTGIKGTLDLSLLVSANIKSGVTINGVNGSSNVVDTANAVLDANFLAIGYSGYDDGVKKSGQLANNTGVWQYAQSVQPTSGRLHMYPPRGLYDPAGGTGVYFDSADYIESNIVSGKSIFGLTGNATISSLGGIKYKRYDNVSPVGTETFKDINNNSLSMYVVDITGFDFSPSYAIFVTPQLGTSVYIDGTVYTMNGIGTGRNYQIPPSSNKNIIISYGRLRIPEPQHGSCIIVGY